MTDRSKLARQTPVSVSQDLLEIEPLLAHEDEDLLDLLGRSVQQPATRLIGVVGSDGRLVGVLPILRLIESVVARVAPESLLADISDIADVARFGHAVEARLARDAMVEPGAVGPDLPIGDAFRIMHQRHLSALYVVDADGRPSGYLDLLELAMLYVDALKAQARAGSEDAANRLDPPQAGDASTKSDR